MVWISNTKHATTAVDGREARLAIRGAGHVARRTGSFAARPTKHVQPSGLRTTGACSISEPSRKQKAGRPRSTEPHGLHAWLYGSCLTPHRSGPVCAAIA